MLSAEKPERFRRETVFFAAGFILFSLALLYPVYLNGFPILNYDTGTYLESAITLQPPLDRPIGYSLFLTTARLFHSLLAATVIQAAITAYLLVQFLKSYLGYRPLPVLSILAGVLLFTPLPFVASFLYPDITSFWVPLAGLLFFKKDRAPGRKFFCLLILALAALASYVNVVLVLFTIVVINAAIFFRSPSKGACLKRSGWQVAVLLIFFSLLPPSLNFFLDYGFVYSKTSHVFIFGNFVTGRNGGVLGNALRDLKNTDPENPLNDHLDILLADKERGPSWFLWSSDSPLQTDSRLRGWRSNRKYLQPVIDETIRNELPAVLNKIRRDFLRQLTMIQPGYFCRRVGNEAKILAVLGDAFPDQKEKYLRSRQNRGSLLRLMAENRVDDFLRWAFIVTASSAVLLLILIPVLKKIGMIALPGKDFYLRMALPGFLLAFYLFNTLAVTATGGISPRYSTRVSALALLACFTIIARLRPVKPVT